MATTAVKARESTQRLKKVNLRVGEKPGSQSFREFINTSEGWTKVFFCFYSGLI